MIKSVSVTRSDGEKLRLTFTSGDAAWEFYLAANSKHARAEMHNEIKTFSNADDALRELDRWAS